MYQHIYKPQLDLGLNLSDMARTPDIKVKEWGARGRDSNGMG